MPVVTSQDNPRAQAQSPATIPKGTPWETALLSLLGAPLTASNYKFVNQWAAREHPHNASGGFIISDTNNPFDTTAGAGGSVGPYKAGTYPSLPGNAPGVAVYPDLATGVAANAYHIGTQYPGIFGALKSGKPEQFANDPRFQSDLRKWSGGGYSQFASIAQPAAPIGPGIERPIATGGQGQLDALVNAYTNPKLSPYDNPSVTMTLDPKTGKWTTTTQTPPHFGGLLGSGQDFYGWISNPKNLLRIAEVVAGGALTLVGIIMVGKAASSPQGSPVRDFSGAARTVARR